MVRQEEGVCLDLQINNHSNNQGEGCSELLNHNSNSREVDYLDLPRIINHNNNKQEVYLARLNNPNSKRVVFSARRNSPNSSNSKEGDYLEVRTKIRREGEDHYSVPEQVVHQCLVNPNPSNSNSNSNNSSNHRNYNRAKRRMEDWDKARYGNRQLGVECPNKI